MVTSCENIFSSSSSISLSGAEFTSRDDYRTTRLPWQKSGGWLFLNQPHRLLIEIKEAGIFSTNRSAAQRSVRIEEVGFLLDQPKGPLVLPARKIARLALFQPIKARALANAPRGFTKTMEDIWDLAYT